MEIKRLQKIIHGKRTSFKHFNECRRSCDYSDRMKKFFYLSDILTDYNQNISLSKTKVTSFSGEIILEQRLS